MRIYIYVPREIFNDVTVRENLRTRLHDSLIEFYGEFQPDDIKFLAGGNNNISVYIMEEALLPDSSGRIINSIRDILGYDAMIRLNYQKLNPDFRPDNYRNVQSVKTEESSYRISRSPALVKQSLSFNLPFCFPRCLIPSPFYSPSCSVYLTMQMLLNLLKERFALNEVKSVLFVELRTCASFRDNALFDGAIAEGYTHIISSIGYDDEIIEGSIEWIIDQNYTADPNIRKLLKDGSVIITR